jgi:hypothetical protein
VRNSRQEDPQKSVFPLGGDSCLVVIRRNSHLTFESAMVNLHGHHSHRFARCGEGNLLLLERFGRFAVSSDPEPAQPNFNFDLVGFNAGQFNADSKAGRTLKNVDRRTPLNARVMKIGEMDLGNLVGNFANLAFEQTQAEGTGFSAHSSQWTRCPIEANGKSS